MKRILSSLICLILAGHLTRFLIGARAGGDPVATARPERVDVRFRDAAPYASAVEVRRRLGTPPNPAPFSLSNETFRLMVPTNYSTNRVWGLLVWISPADTPRIPDDWRALFESRNLIVVSPNRSGNSRHLLDRFELALNTVWNAQRMYRIDPNRIFVAGFSGGGRVASMLGIGYSDLFRGTIAVCGVDFYLPVSAGAGRIFPATYVPTTIEVERAKQSHRFALVTGEKDPNRLNTAMIFQEGFRKNGFAAATFLDIPGMGHAIPSAEKIAPAFDFLEPAK